MEILFALQENPIANVSSIAKRVNMSVSGTAIRLDKIANIEKAYKRVHTDLNLKALDLELHDFFYNIDSRKSLEKIEKIICDDHPYTLYRSRCFGKFSGLYVQYRTPVNGLPYLIDLAEKLKDKGVVIDYDYIKRNTLETSVTLKSAIKFWNPQRNTWQFDWNSWREGFDAISLASIAKSNNVKSIISNFDELDIKLLDEIILDARQKNVDIIKKLNLEKEPGIAQKISRKINFLKEFAVDNYRIFLNYEVFNLYQSIIIRGYCSKTIARKFRNYLLLGSGHTKKVIDYSPKTKLLSFPFQSVYYISENGFFWFVKAPPAHLSELVDFIWSICPKHDIFWTSYRYSMIYNLWDQAFDFKNKRWIMNDDFMVNNIISKL